MQFQVTGTVCPKCHKPIRVATVSMHPTRHDVAQQNYQCENCGPVLTKDISLSPGMSAQAQNDNRRTHS